MIQYFKCNLSIDMVKKENINTEVNAFSKIQCTFIINIIILGIKENALTLVKGNNKNPPMILHLVKD